MTPGPVFEKLLEGEGLPSTSTITIPCTRCFMKEILFIDNQRSLIKWESAAFR